MLKPYVGLLVFAAGLYAFIRWVGPLMLPFFLGLTLAVLIDGPVSALERRRIPRAIAVLVILAALFLVLTFLTLYGSAALAAELTELSRMLPSIWETLLATTRELQLYWETLSLRLPDNVVDALTQQRQALFDWLLSSTGQLLEAVRRWALQGLPNGVVILMITAMATYLMSRDKQGILSFLPRLIPRHWRPRAVAATHLFVSSAFGFINALVVLLAVTTLLTAVGLRLLGSSYAAVLGVLCGLLDLVPVLGPGLVFIPWVLYHLVLGELAFGLWLALLYALITVVRAVLEPRIIGSRTGIHPLSALIALYVGLRLFGAMGFIIGPLVAILIKSLVRVGLLALDTEDEPGTGTQEETAPSPQETEGTTGGASIP